MLFDAYNPWAPLIQLNSTHPLTGRRIAHLGRLAKEQGQDFSGYDVEAAAARVKLSRGRLWGKFLFELLLLAVPVIAVLIALTSGVWPLALAAGALGVLATLPLRYPFRAPANTTVMALMSDPAASPVRAKSVRLEGKAIGRVNAGFIAGEDMIYQDKTGLMAVDFRSMLGFIGDLFAGWKRVPKHFDQPGERHRLVQARYGRLSGVEGTILDGRHAPRQAALLAGLPLPHRYRRKCLSRPVQRAGLPSCRLS